VNVIAFAFPGVAGVRCFFQTKSAPSADEPAELAGNISLTVGAAPAAAANRRELAALCRVAGPAEVRQVHGATTVFDPAPCAAAEQPAVEADGMATDRPGLALMIKTADCQPVLLCHLSGRCVAALHVGWRGNRVDYPGTGVRDFCARYRIRPEEVLAVRGPSLGPSAAEFVHFDAEWGAEFEPWYDRRTRTMDLWQLTRSQLLAAGLLPNRLFSLDLCTHTLAGSFFSYRRSERCGRQGSLVVID
jgi:copper oxidase (laccase) domain-containing protein